MSMTARKSECTGCEHIQARGFGPRIPPMVDARATRFFSFDRDDHSHALVPLGVI